MVHTGVLLRFIPIADANDEAQFGELYVQLELTERAWKHGVQMTACFVRFKNLRTSGSYTRAEALAHLIQPPRWGFTSDAGSVYKTGSCVAPSRNTSSP